MSQDSYVTYDAVANIYDGVRPGYPEVVYSTIDAYRPAVLGRPRVLEVGVGTGQATSQMLRSGWDVTGVEPGVNLAGAAARRFPDHPYLRIVNSRFEDFPSTAGPFDVIASATAWHWVDPAIGYRRAADLLRPGATIALWWNAHVPEALEPGWAVIRQVYERVAPRLARLAPLAPDRPNYDPAEEVRASGFFTDVRQSVVPFTVQYSTLQFLELIGTYASHTVLGQDQRERLHGELALAIDEDLGGRITKPYRALVVLASRSVRQCPGSSCR